VIGEDHFGFRKEKGTRYPPEMLIISSKGALDMNVELCACFVEWMKAIDRVNWKN
jgi:hypothetical protein